MSTTRPRARAPGIFISYCAMATTTATTAMMTTNVDDKALCVSTQHIYIVSRDGDEDGARAPGIFISRRAAATTKQLLATTNEECRTARPRVRAHYMWRRVRATMSYHSNNGGDDEDTNVDEQAVCIAPNIDATINYKRQHRHYNSYLLNRQRQLS